MAQIKKGVKMSIKAYKGFDKDLKCKPNGSYPAFQFEVGKEYEEKEAVCCEKGFHACINPLDILCYKDLCDSEFCEVELDGIIDKNKANSKFASTKIKIGAKLGLKGFINASVNFLLENCKSTEEASSGYNTKQVSSGDNTQQASSGYGAQQASSGDNTRQASSGDYTKQASSGYGAQQASSGDNTKQASSGYNTKQVSSGDYTIHDMNQIDGVAAAIGKNSKIKGKIGNWITLAEWEYSEKDQRDKLVCVKSIQIDGKIIKEDTYYTLRNCEFTDEEKVNK